MEMPARALVLGGEGYAGWPLALHLCDHGWAVTVADNGAARAAGGALGPVASAAERLGACRRALAYYDVDLCDGEAARELVRRVQPGAVVHVATGAPHQAVAILLKVHAALVAQAERCQLLVVSFAETAPLERLVLASALAALRGPGGPVQVAELGLGTLWGLQTAATRCHPLLWNRYAPRAPRDLAVHALLQLPAVVAVPAFSELDFDCLHLDDFVELVRHALGRSAAEALPSARRWEGKSLAKVMASDARVELARSDLAELERSAAAARPVPPQAAPPSLTVLLHCADVELWARRVETAWATARSQRCGEEQVRLQLCGGGAALRRVLGDAAFAPPAPAAVDVLHVMLRRTQRVPWALLLRAAWAGTAVVITPLDLDLPLFGGPWLCALLFPVVALEEGVSDAKRACWRAAPAAADFAVTREPAAEARQRLPSWRALEPELRAKRFVALLCGEAPREVLAVLGSSAVLAEGAVVLAAADHHGEACYAGRGGSLSVVCHRELSGSVSPTLLQGVDVVLYLGGPLEAPAAALLTGVPVVWRLTDTLWETPLWAFDPNGVRFLCDVFSVADFEAALLDAIALPRGGQPAARRRAVPTPAEALDELCVCYRRVVREHRRLDRAWHAWALLLGVLAGAVLLAPQVQRLGPLV